MRGNDAAIPAAPRKTLLEWIEQDDGDTAGNTKPACNARTTALHAKILLSAGGASPEPIPCPAGLRLPPLG